MGLLIDKVLAVGIVPIKPIEGGSIQTAIQNVMNFVFFIAGVLAVVYLVMAGIQYITAGGDTAKAGTARQGITNAITGIIVILIATIIVNTTMWVVKNGYSGGGGGGGTPTATVTGGITPPPTGGTVTIPPTGGGSPTTVSEALDISFAVNPFPQGEEVQVTYSGSSKDAKSIVFVVMEPGWSHTGDLGIGLYRAMAGEGEAQFTQYVSCDTTCGFGDEANVGVTINKAGTIPVYAILSKTEPGTDPLPSQMIKIVSTTVTVTP